jgi:hypothetical protein
MFALATGLGSGIWNAVFVVAGYAFGQAGGDALEGFVRIYSSVVAGIGILAAVGLATQRIRSRRDRAPEAGEAGEIGEAGDTDEVHQVQEAAEESSDAEAPSTLEE